MSMHTSTRQTELEDKKVKLLKLINGKSQKMVEQYLNKEHKSLSHLTKPHQELHLNSARIAILDRLINFVSRL